jgi:hypothetical protein
MGLDVPGPTNLEYTIVSVLPMIGFKNRFASFPPISLIVALV